MSPAYPSESAYAITVGLEHGTAFPSLCHDLHRNDARMLNSSCTQATLTVGRIVGRGRDGRSSDYLNFSRSSQILPTPRRDFELSTQCTHSTLFSSFLKKFESLNSSDNNAADCFALICGSRPLLHHGIGSSSRTLKDCPIITNLCVVVVLPFIPLSEFSVLFTEGSRLERDRGGQDS